MLPPTRARVMRAFGKTIRNLRKRAGISQQDLALEAKMSIRHMSALELGERSPRIDTVTRLLYALKISWITYSAEFEAHLRSEKNNNRHLNS